MACEKRFKASVKKRGAGIRGGGQLIMTADNALRDKGRHH